MLGKVGTEHLSPLDLKLMSLISALSRNLCSESLFDHVISLSRERLHGRLQSVHRKVPKHLRHIPTEPLHQELRKVAAHLERQRQRQRPSARSKRLIERLCHVCDLYHRINSCKEHTDEELQLLKDAVRQSHALATSDGKCTIEGTLLNHGLDSHDIGSNKVVRQLNKIGRYWGLCIDMAEASRKYGDTFHRLELKIIPSYQAIRSSISFVKGRMAKCHVHAEIQLLTFYELNLNLATVKPRVLGVSKSACYLCNMFILKHGCFFITKTHGRLYDLWNVPNLAEFGQLQRNKFRQVLKTMNEELRTNLIKERKHTRRDLPLGSYVNLPKGIPQSAVHSSAATLPPVELQSTRKGLEPKAGLPGAQVTPIPQPPRSLAPSMNTVPFTALPTNIDSLLPRAPTPPVSAPGDHSQEIALCTTDSKSTVLSCTSIESWELPLHRTIISTSPFRVSDERLSVQIEFEGPGQGQVTVSGVAKTKRRLPKNIVDLRAMVPNEIMQIARADGDSTLELSLSHGHFRYIQMTFHWLP